jgi:DNA polymerase-3 subunit delta
MTTTFEKIMADLNNKAYHPVYFLSGEEPYFIDRIAETVEKEVLSDQEKEFNLSVLYGRDLDTPTILSYVKRYPMMAPYHVIIIKEAQEIRKIEELQPYIENPMASTILVICYKYKKVDKRKAFARALEKNSVFFETSRLYEERVPEWIRGFLKQKGYAITPTASMLLTEYLGTDLTTIVNELGKMTINLPAATEINEDHVEQNIGISKEYNVFELQKALGSRNVMKANRIIRHFASNEKENPLVKIVAILYGFFSKVLLYHQLKDKSRSGVATALAVHPYFVQDYQTAAAHFPPAKLATIISYLREYDLKAKGVENVTATDGELLKELIFRILH